MANNERRTLREWQAFINALIEKHGEDAPALFHRNYGFLVVGGHPRKDGPGWLNSEYYSLEELKVE